VQTEIYRENKLSNVIASYSEAECPFTQVSSVSGSKPRFGCQLFLGKSKLQNPLRWTLTAMQEIFLLAPVFYQV